MDDWVGYSRLMELIFEIPDAEEGGFYARALGHAIFTEGETWEELRANLLEAVSVHFEDAPARPRRPVTHREKWTPRVTTEGSGGLILHEPSMAPGIEALLTFQKRVLCGVSVNCASRAPDEKPPCWSLGCGYFRTTDNYI